MGLCRPVPLSVLDLSPIRTGYGPSDALRNSTDLARAVERLGYRRLWVAEHHNMPGIASSAPAVLIAHLAASTERIRVGSGGVMLPNHAPLVVAEQFGTLEALHPGRIDLGIGRAPGTDPATAAALRRSPLPLSHDDFPEELTDLVGFFRGAFPPGHPYHRIRAVPGEGDMPALWLLGSTGYSAQAAALLGLPFAFAHHFSPANTVPALALYRERFRPSEALSEPYAMVAVAVVAAGTSERARWLHGSSRLSVLRLRSGMPGPLPSPEEAAARPYTPDELERIAAFTGDHVVGDPEDVRRGLDDLLDRTGADELMVTSNVYEPAERIRSFELVAELAGLAPRTPQPAPGWTSPVS
jgi:luciferase family oxidoreductase group 1